MLERDKELITARIMMLQSDTDVEAKTYFTIAVCIIIISDLCSEKTPARGEVALVSIAFC